MKGQILEPWQRDLRLRRTTPSDIEKQHIGITWVYLQGSQKAKCGCWAIARIFPCSSNPGEGAHCMPCACTVEVQGGVGSERQIKNLQVSKAYHRTHKTLRSLLDVWWDTVWIIPCGLNAVDAAAMLLWELSFEANRPTAAGMYHGRRRSPSPPLGGRSRLTARDEQRCLAEVGEPNQLVQNQALLALLFNWSPFAWNKVRNHISCSSGEMLAQEVPLPGALGPSASLQPQALSSRHCFAAGQGSLLSSLALQMSNEKARVVYGI